MMGTALHIDFSAARSFVEILRWRAQYQPGRRAFTFLEYGDSASEESCTYETLDLRVRAIAARLQRKAQPGARAVLMLPSGIDYVACVLA
jgi:acyl-CoA synthetase (AMP-forming)/AMP-acid ligase II